MSHEIVTLHSPGPIAGLPGASHGPGTFLIDWQTRQIMPLMDERGSGQTEETAAEAAHSAGTGTAPAQTGLSGQ